MVHGPVGRSRESVAEQETRPMQAKPAPPPPVGSDICTNRLTARVAPPADVQQGFQKYNVPAEFCIHCRVMD